MAHAHVETGMQIEPEAGKDVRLGGAAAADAVVALEHGHAQAGARKVSGKRQAIVTGADDNSVELGHLQPPFPRKREIQRKVTLEYCAAGSPLARGTNGV